MKFAANFPFYLALLFGASVAPSSSNSNASLCCNALFNQFPADTFIKTVPLSTEYQVILAEYLSKTSRLEANCFIQPKSTNQVSKIVTTLVHHQCLFAVKSGGAQLNPGQNDLVDGVTLDLSQISSVKLSSDNASVSIGAGAQWGHVYQTLDPLGYTIPGARATDIGVAGLTLAGGLTNYNARFGWGFDLVKAYEVVLANGSVTTVTAKQNTDLFQALKGGGQGNFGIVTRIDFVSVKIGALWGGLALYDFKDISKFYQPAVDWINRAAQHPYGTFVVAWTNNATTGNTTIANEYQATDDATGKGYYDYKTPARSSSHFPDALKEFAFDKVGVPTSNTLRIDTSYNFAYSANAASNERFLIGNIFFKNDVTVFANVDRIAQEVLSPYLKKTEPYPYNNFQVEYQPLPHIVNDISQSKGGNVLGLERVKANIVQLLIVADWVNSANDKLIENLIIEIFKRVTAYIKSVPGAFIDYQYLGLATQDQDVLGSYGQDNINYLKKISKKYDPAQVFQTLVPGGFKLTDAGSRMKEYNFNQFLSAGSN